MKLNGEQEQPGMRGQAGGKRKVLMAASVASMIDQFNIPNIHLMQQMGYEVHTACNFREGNTCDRQQVRVLSEKLRQMHVTAHQWDCPRSIYSIKKCWAAYLQLCRLMSDIPFAWVHCHSPIGGVLARIAAHRAGIPVIYTAHGFHFYKGAPLRNWMLFYPVEHRLARWTDVLITVNKEDYRFAGKRLRAGQVFYIPGIGIDTRRFDDRHFQKRQVCSERKGFRRKYQIPDNSVLLLSVGELSRRKNHKAVLSALAGMPERDIYYMICGQGAWKKRLMRYASRRGIAERVRMVGFQSDVDVLYRNADIFVFPSRQEGMPAALMEAMAAGLPCIVSDIRGNRELVGRFDHGSAGFKAEGIRFSLNRPQQLRKAIRFFAEHPYIRQTSGEHGREKIKAFDTQAVQKRMRKIYAIMAEEENKHKNNAGTADEKRMKK